MFFCSEQGSTGGAGGNSLDSVLNDSIDGDFVFFLTILLTDLWELFTDFWGHTLFFLMVRMVPLLKP